MMIIFLIFSLLSHACYASTSSTLKLTEPTEVVVPTSLGSYALDASLAWFGPGGNDQSIHFIGAVEYFVFDRLSIGGVLGAGYFESSGDHETFISRSRSFGPSATYYFYEEGAFTAYVNQAFIYREGSSSENKSSGRSNISALGFKYFLAPNVAIGPKLSASYAKGETGFTNLTGQFSFHF